MKKQPISGHSRDKRCNQSRENTSPLRRLGLQNNVYLHTGEVTAQTHAKPNSSGIQ